MLLHLSILFSEILRSEPHDFFETLGRINPGRQAIVVGSIDGAIDFMLDSVAQDSVYLPFLRQYLLYELAEARKLLEWPENRLKTLLFKIDGDVLVNLNPDERNKFIDIVFIDIAAYKKDLAEWWNELATGQEYQGRG